MYGFFSIVIVIASIIMIFVVMVQKSKGGGLAEGFTSFNQVVGARKATDLPEKITWALAILIVVLSIVSTGLIKSSAGAGGDSMVKGQVQGTSAPAPTNTSVPFGTPAPTTAAPQNEQ